MDMIKKQTSLKINSMKKLVVIAVVFLLTGCAELQKAVNYQLGQQGGVLSQLDIEQGLRQALDNGIQNQVTKLTAVDGFYRNELVKILLPKELQVVDKTLRKVGLGKLADEGLKVINRAAEDAVKTATPVFVNAVKEITFTDAKNILLGADNSATSYLQGKTQKELYSKFNPIIKKSFAKVGADQIWTNLINKYNSLIFVKKVNPNLTDYVTNEALNGVFKMITLEEKKIRNNIGARNTDLLRKVFALQDYK